MHKNHHLQKENLIKRNKILILNIFTDGFFNYF